MLINPIIVTRLERDLFDGLSDEVGNMHRLTSYAREIETRAVDPGFLACDINAGL